MTLNRRTYKLSEMCTITSSKRIYREEYVSSGIPFFRGKEIIQLHNNEEISETLFISQTKFDEINKHYGIPQTNDILLTSVGTLGIPLQVKEEYLPFYFKDGNLTWFKD